MFIFEFHLPLYLFVVVVFLFFCFSILVSITQCVPFPRLYTCVFLHRVYGCQGLMSVCSQSRFTSVVSVVVCSSWASWIFLDFLPPPLFFLHLTLNQINFSLCFCFWTLSRYALYLGCNLLHMTTFWLLGLVILSCSPVSESAIVAKK